MKKVLSFALALILTFSMSVPTFASATATVKSFSDVPDSHWAHDIIMVIADWGLINGTTVPVDGVGVFEPEASMSRAAFIKIVVSYVYNDKPITVQQGQEWWMPYVDIAIKNKLIDDGEMSDLNAPMSRQEMAKVLVRASKALGQSMGTLISTDRIADYATIDSAYQNYVRQCFTLGLLCGVDSQGTFMPYGTLTRAEAATVVYRLIYGGVQQSDASNTTAVETKPEEPAIENPIPDTVEFPYPNAPKLPKIETTINSSTIVAGKLPEAYADERPTLDKNATVDDAENTLNGYVGAYYGRRFFNDGISYNDEEKGGVAYIVKDEAGRWGIHIFEWRNSYDSNIADNCVLNMVYEAMIYLTGDRMVAHALWNWVDDIAINGASANSDDYGFTDVDWHNGQGTITMNGIVVELVNNSDPGFTLYIE